MEKTFSLIFIFLFSFCFYGQNFKEVKKSGLFHFQINVIRYIHAPRGVAEARTVINTNTSVECSYYINGAESEKSRSNKGQKNTVLNAIKVEMQYQFFEFLNKKYPIEMDKLKHLGYNIICQVIETPNEKPMFREYTQSSKRAVKMLNLNTIPSNPIPDYDAKKIIFIDDFTYNKGCLMEEKTKVGNIIVSKFHHSRDHNGLLQEMNEFSKRLDKYMRQENWKYLQKTNRRN